MQIPKPSPEVKQAVHAAVAWFDPHKLTGVSVERYTLGDGEATDIRLVADSLAPNLWARYYDLELCQPFFCDRDGVPRRRLQDIGHERRNGYVWYSNVE